jgi:hypothetical protein
LSLAPSRVIEQYDVVGGLHVVDEISDLIADEHGSRN